MSKISNLIQNIKQGQKDYYLTGMVDAPTYRRLFYGSICFLVIFYTEMNSQRLFIRVASSTYTTMLALIPFVIVGGSILLAFNSNTDINTMVEEISNFLMPVVGENDKITKFIQNTLSRTQSVGMGPVGVISLLVTTVMLFVHIEDNFNDIWHVVKPRAFYLRILLFYAVVTLAPFLVSISILDATKFVPEVVAGERYWKFFTETLLIAVLCFVSFKFLPHTRVNLKSALIPALLAAVLIEIAKSCFGIYMSLAFSTNARSNYNILYGFLGIIPVMLLWIYLTWMMILFAVEMGYCLQNLRNLRLRMCMDSSSEGESWVFLGPYAPLEVLSALVRNLCDGRDPMNAEEISVECIYPIQAVEAILARLENINVVKKVDSEFASTYILARPLDTIAMNEIMKSFDESSPRVKTHPRLDALISQLLAAQENIWTGCNANMLREDGVTLKDVGKCPTMPNLHVEE